MATPSLQWDASLVSLKVTTASGGVVTMAFPDRATDVSFSMPLTALTNPMTAAGDVIVATTDGVPERLALGTNGQVLQSNGTAAVWATLSYLTNPMTTAQDIIVGGASGAPGRLAVGAEGEVLGISSGAVAWITPSTGFTNPMTAVGDLILGGTAGAATRLAIGATGKVLTSNGTTATWEAPVTGFSNPMTTLGDIITANTGGTAKRLGVGSEGQVLKVVSGEPAWAAESGAAANYYALDPMLTHTWTMITDGLTTGSRFITTIDTTCVGGYYYGSAGKSYKITFYNDAGTLLATKTVTADSTGINYATFDTPVSITKYAPYLICNRSQTSDARYYSISGYLQQIPYRCSDLLVIIGHYYISTDNRPTNLDTAAAPIFPKF